jgi:hypothetical protein
MFACSELTLNIRLATLTFIVMVTLFLSKSGDSTPAANVNLTISCIVIPFPNCNAVSLAISVLSICTCVTTTYLFLLRVRAIFHGHRLIVGFFVILWVAVNGASILVPFSTQAGNIPGTQQCITTYMHPRAAIYAILHIINHILTFFSISWKLVVMQHGGPGDMRRILQGKDFPRLSRAIWSSGQLYFLYVLLAFLLFSSLTRSTFFFSTTIGLNIVNITFMLHPKLHPLYHSMLVTANVGLENAMATRIFRQLKFDAGRQYIDTIVQSSFGPHSHSYPNSNTAANDSGRSKGAHGGAYTDSGQGSLPLALMNGAPSQALQVNVQKHVENGSVALEVKSSAY